MTDVCQEGRTYVATNAASVAELLVGEALSSRENVAAYRARQRSIGG